ncbi:MAG: ribbon-helix-helix domain-containing protein [Candidatus Helarchaeota archaeon]
MKTISVNVPEAFVKGLEELVQKGLYANRSEAIRVAIRDLLKRELYDAEYSYSTSNSPSKIKDEKYIKEEQTVTI